MPFTTFDQDHDARDYNCAVRYHGAWWYNAPCHHANLNGKYLYGDVSAFGVGVNWFSWRGHEFSFKKTEMKMRPITQ